LVLELTFEVAVTVGPNAGNLPIYSGLRYRGQEVRSAAGAMSFAALLDRIHAFGVSDVVARVVKWAIETE